MNTEFYVIRVRCPNSTTPLYYNAPVGYPGESVPFDRAQHFEQCADAESVLLKMTAAGDVGYIHPVYKEEDEFYLDEAIVHNLRPPTAALLRAKGPKEFIIALADSFPCLRGKVEVCGFTAQNWDVEKWVKYSGPWAHGEHAAAMFVANVWNPSEAKSRRWKFDVLDAISVWDNNNRAAFIAWAKNPVWP